MPAAIQLKNTQNCFFFKLSFTKKTAAFTTLKRELYGFMTVIIIMEHKINLAREDKYLGIHHSDKLTLEYSLAQLLMKFDFPAIHSSQQATVIFVESKHPKI